MSANLICLPKVHKKKGGGGLSPAPLFYPQADNSKNDIIKT